MAVTPNSIITPQTPVFRFALATLAETAWQAPTAANLGLLVDDAANPNGMRLTAIYAIQRAAVTSNLNCSLYRKTGSVYTLIDSVLLLANTPSAQVANAKADFGYGPDNPLELEAGVGLAVGIGAAIGNGIVFVARGGAF